ncbi:hypothetical protein ACFWY6_03500 [Streptomyces sp. NPDC059037]
MHGESDLLSGARTNDEGGPASSAQPRKEFAVIAVGGESLLP